MCDSNQVVCHNLVKIHDEYKILFTRRQRLCAHVVSPIEFFKLVFSSSSFLVPYFRMGILTLYASQDNWAATIVFVKM